MDSIQEKNCSRCKVIKPVSNFGQNKSTPTGLNIYCKECIRIQSKEYAKRHPEKIREKVARYANKHPEKVMARRKRWLQKRTTAQRRKDKLLGYGLTLDDYDSLLKKQNGRCAICECQPNGKNLCVDHNHTTGKIRGLLCLFCNTMLGKFSDDESRVMRIVGYLQDYK